MSSPQAHLIYEYLIQPLLSEKTTKKPRHLIKETYKNYYKYRPTSTEFLGGADPLYHTTFWVYSKKPAARADKLHPETSRPWSPSLCHIMGCCYGRIKSLWCTHTQSIEKWVTEVLMLKEGGYWFTYEIKDASTGDDFEILPYKSRRDMMVEYVFDSSRGIITKIDSDSNLTEADCNSRPTCWSEIDGLPIKNLRDEKIISNLMFKQGEEFDTFLYGIDPFKLWYLKIQKTPHIIWVTCNRPNDDGAEMKCRFSIPVIDILELNRKTGTYEPTLGYQSFSRRFFNLLQSDELTKTLGTIHLMCNCLMCTKAQHLYARIQEFRRTSEACISLLNHKQCHTRKRVRDF